MCRILAVKNFDLKLHKNIVETFTELAETGHTLPEDKPGHTDGWGIGYYDGKDAVVFKSGKSITAEKDIFQRKINEIKKSSVLIVHLRKSAWPETNSAKNSHPFKKNNIIFAHNGTIRDYLKIKKTKAPALDSEVYFEYIMSFYKDDVGEALEMASANLKKSKHSSLTCVISDGKNLYAFREYAKSPDYYTLFLASLRDSKIICSEKIVKTLRWKILRKEKICII